MKTADRRLNRMIEIADELDIQLDHVVAHMARCSWRRFRALSENPSRLLTLMGAAAARCRDCASTGGDQVALASVTAGNCGGGF